MKASSIRIRISEEDKAKIEAFADRTDKSVSEILRRAAAVAIHGDVPGAEERHACATIRRSANRVLSLMDEKPVDFARFRTAINDLRTAARELVQCR